MHKILWRRPLRASAVAPVESARMARAGGATRTCPPSLGTAVPALLLLAGAGLLPSSPSWAQGDLDFLFNDTPASESASESSDRSQPQSTETTRQDAAATDTPSGDSKPFQPVPDESETQADDTATSARPSRSRLIEEIVVTAQKRKESLQEVPISISAFSGDFLQQYAITDFKDLSQLVPNARIDPNGSLPQLSIRGFNANPVNRAFEQPISLVVDGVTYGTSVYFQTPLYDIERVEVLRGPQGTLFGKNSIAGAFNIVTRSPSPEEYEGNISVQSGELDQRRVEAGFGGPVIRDFLNFRVAGLVDEREGQFTNTTARLDPDAIPNPGGFDRNAVRAKLDFPDLLGVNLDLGYEYVDVAIFGFGAEFEFVNPALESVYAAYDPNFDTTPNNYVNSVDGDELTTIEGDTYTLNADYDLGGWGITGVGGYSDLQYSSNLDADYGPTPAAILQNIDGNEQITFELRTTSPNLDGLFGLKNLFGFDLGGSRLTAGLFYQDRRINDGVSRLFIDPVSVSLLLGTDRATDGNDAPLLPTSPVPLVNNPIVNNTADDEITTIFFEQQTESTAGFAQFEWFFTEKATLQIGMRYTVEDKAADWVLDFEQGTGVASMVAFGREEYTASRERSEKSFTPKILVKYDFWDDDNVYLGWVKGFRAGGYNQFASTPDDGDLEYDNEDVISWEAGTKMRLLGGAAKLNIGLFWMELDNFQVLTQEPDTAVFRVENAGMARARGIEMDGQWLPTDWLTVLGTFAFNDSEFLEFPLGTCTLDNQNTDGDADERCDLEGEPLDFAPRYTGTLGLRGDWNLPFFRLRATGGAIAIYQDDYFADVAVRDPRIVQEAVTTYNADFGFGSQDGNWTVRVLGKNLSDEQVALFKSDVPTVSRTFYQTLQPGRRILGEFLFRF